MWECESMRGIDDLQTFELEVTNIARDDRHAVGKRCRGEHRIRNGRSKPLRNWGWVFNKWRLNKDLFERLRDPERIPDARKGGAKRKSDNWRGTKKEEVGNVLG